MNNLEELKQRLEAKKQENRERLSKLTKTINKEMERKFCSLPTSFALPKK